MQIPAELSMAWFPVMVTSWIVEFFKVFSCIPAQLLAILFDILRFFIVRFEEPIIPRPPLKLFDSLSMKSSVSRVTFLADSNMSPPPLFYALLPIQVIFLTYKLVMDRYIAILEPSF